MTRAASVSELKSNRLILSRGDDGKPRQGTKLRQAYDALRRGETVSLKGMGVTAHTLTDMYGMDIKGVYNEGRRGLAGSRLVGEWDGPYYVPIERIVQDAN